MSWKPEYALLIIFSTIVDYFIGIKIEEAVTKSRKKLFLSVSIIINMGVLVFFKYFNFFSETSREIMGRFSLSFDPVLLKVILPIGISFYTFQALTYTIDIYRNNIKAERHLGIFATYIIYFPQLVAGPIERAKNLIPQFHEKHYFDYERIISGLRLMLWGFFKKIVIADRLSVVVNTVYNNPTNYSGTALILATVFFAFQIFCDFSGYTDIAIGAARVMGFRLMDNFKRPYFSRSISEFWKRWHISLSTWFKDYLYIPLGGNRVSIPRWYFNLFIVFLISGLWHGANWTFVVWGALHGVYMILEIITKALKNNLLKIIQLIKFPKIVQLIEIFITFVLVNIAWVFFRANTISEAIYVLSHAFKNINFNISEMHLGVGLEGLVIALILIVFMEIVHFIQERISIGRFLDSKPMILRWAIYITVVLLIIFLGKGGEQFIYFQF